MDAKRNWKTVIERLLKQAAGTTNPHERDSFFAKAAELMVKFGIEEATLNWKESKNARNQNVETLTIDIGGASDRQRWHLLVATARVFGCRSIRLINSTLVRVYGFEYDLELIKMLYESILIQMFTALAVAKNSGEKPKGMHGKTFNTSFTIGFIDGAIKVLERAYQDQKDEAIRESPGNEIALRDHDQLIKNKYNQDFPFTRNGSSMHVSSSDVYNNGMSAGSRVDVGQTRITGRRAIGR